MGWGDLDQEGSRVGVLGVGILEDDSREQVQIGNVEEGGVAVVVVAAGEQGGELRRTHR